VSLVEYTIIKQFCHSYIFYLCQQPVLVKEEEKPAEPEPGIWDEKVYEFGTSSEWRINLMSELAQQAMNKMIFLILPAPG